MSLVRCYREASSLLASAAEPYSVVECAERHRLYWRPPRVHTILLAESHVYTHAAENVAMAGIEDIELASAPTCFVRLVYCLGYGEPEFVGQRLTRNVGTWQYWKLFASCVHGPTQDAFAPVLKGQTPDFQARLRAKIDLLAQLRKLGVWLLDASILALYSPGAKRPHDAAYERILRCCWEHHVGPAIEAADPHSLVVIGQRVRATLCSELEALSGIEIHGVSQPQARMSAQQITGMHMCLHEVCHRAAKARRAS